MKTNKYTIKNKVAVIFLIFIAVLSPAIVEAQVKSRMPVIVKPVPIPSPKPSPTPILVQPKPVPGVRPGYYEYRKINLVHQYQEYNLCFPTSGSMVLSKFGFNYPPRQIKLASRLKPYFGWSTPFNDFTGMTPYEYLSALKYLNINNCRLEFLPSRDANKALENLKNSIRSGYPVITFFWFGRTGHAVVACGFDDRRQELITLDPAYPSPVAVRNYSYEYLKNVVWKNPYTNYYGGAFMNPVQATAMRASTMTDPKIIESMNTVY